MPYLPLCPDDRDAESDFTIGLGEVLDTEQLTKYPAVCTLLTVPLRGLVRTILADVVSTETGVFTETLCRRSNELVSELSGTTGSKHV